MGAPPGRPPMRTTRLAAALLSSSRFRALALGALLSAAGLLGGCGDAPEPSTAPGAPASAGWTEVAADALRPAQAAQRADAEGARDDLATRLVGRLMQEVTQKGHPSAIAVCRREAPLLAAEVARQRGLAIGRTSFRLRSPMNRVPDWAETLVATRRATPAFLTHPDGRLAALLPIQVQNACLACHGPAAQIAPDVREALARDYPSDQATGFAEGDLRGWFWVEVPAKP